MLQTAVTVIGHHGHEYIARAAIQEGCAAAFRLKKGDLFGADFLYITGDARQVQIGDDASKDQFVLSAVSKEADDLGSAHLNRVVDQLVVIAGAVQAKTI